jgi:hypothetical protein
MGLRQFVGAVLCLGVVQTPLVGARTRAAVSTADPVIIEGHVKDEAGQPLPGVSVVVLPQHGGEAARTTTDHDGLYHVGGLSSEETYRVDFSVGGFHGTRQNHVRPGSDGRARVDVILVLRPVCECVQKEPSPRNVRAQVVDEVGHPLPYALVELTGPKGRITSWADSDGFFLVSPPADGTWSIVASDSGFAPVMHQISKATTGPLTFRLRFVATRELPGTEQFNRGCECPGDLALELR